LLAAISLTSIAIFAGQAQGTVNTPLRPLELPVTKVVLYSSGVGYFEHRGPVTGEVTVSLPFRADEVNDALKSLVVWDFGASDSPSVSYPSQENLDRALKGFRIDLSGSPRIADMLAHLRGAELAVDAPDTITGRIVSVESRPGGKDGAVQVPWLVLSTKDGVRAVSLDDIASFRFVDPLITEDFDRALSLILSTQDSLRRVLKVHLPGSGPRQAALGYVVAAPVWKVSYRLDLSGDKSFLQGWAIIDNPTDQDWKNVSLSLVSGRPVSFQQDLYTPLYLDRPFLPLAIAGIAHARSFESGLLEAAPSEEALADEASGASAPMASRSAVAKSFAAPMAEAAAPTAPLSQGAVAAAGGRAAGDQFEFTLHGAVTLERRQSAMFPLIAGTIDAQKVSVFTPGSTPGGTDPLHPMLGARLANDTGMKLPAGPITVFDGGIYAGDALLDFLSQNDKRLVVFGEDLSVNADVSASNSRETITVTVSKGVMTFARRVTWTRSYSFGNVASEAKKIVVEHPITPGTSLVEPKTFDEKTPTLYRFTLPLPASGTATLVVKESSPEEERITLAALDSDAFVAYASSKEIPAQIRDALRKAIDLKGKADDADRALADLQSRKTDLVSDEARIRENLQAVGRDSPQGQQYMKKLSDSETAIDKLGARIDDAGATSKRAHEAYEAYIAALDLK
jgi:hypothetical protein